MVSIALILIATGAFAGVTRQDGKVALDIQEEGFIITSKSYFTGLMDLTIEKVDDSNYLIHWAWDDLNARTEITNCFEKSGSELTSCAETIKNKYFPVKTSSKVKTDVKKLDKTPLTSKHSSLVFKKVDFNMLPLNGTIELEVKSWKEKGAQVELGFDTTILELTEISIVVSVDPEALSCEEECFHPLLIKNQSDGNVCFSKDELYGEFPEYVREKYLFYEKIEGEPILLDQSVCIESDENLNIYYHYKIPRGVSGKWDLIIKYQGQTYEIDPYFTSSWTFDNTSNYDYNTERIVITDGNVTLKTEYCSLACSGHDNNVDCVAGACSWDEENCEGTPTSCSYFANQTSCETQGGCAWTSQSIVLDYTDNTFESKDYLASAGDIQAVDFNLGDVSLIQGDLNVCIYGSKAYEDKYGDITVGTTFTGVDVPVPVSDTPSSWTCVEISKTYFSSGVNRIGWGCLNCYTPKDYLWIGSDETSPDNTSYWYADGTTTWYALGTLDFGIKIYYDSNQCFGSATACSSYGDDSNCNGQGGCDWDLANCFGDGTCEASIKPKYSLFNERLDGFYNFFEIASKPSNSNIKYQLSDTNGSTWKYFTTSWVSATVGNYTQANTADQVDGNITAFPLTNKQVVFNAILRSGSIPILDQIDINYEVNDKPNNFALTPEPDQNNIQFVNLDWGDTDDNESDPFHYQIWVGLSSGSNNVLDANTSDSNYNNLSVSTNTYYWKVRACENAYPAWCSDWTTEDEFDISTNNPPSTPTLVNEPNQTGVSIIDLDWGASTDDENDSIRYHIQVGTSYQGNDTLDANTTDTNYNGVSVSVDDYYWRVRACDNYYGDGWLNCSDWNYDVFSITDSVCPSGFCIVATVGNVQPAVSNEYLNPISWDGTGALLVTYKCTDPNGHNDLNRTYIVISGSNSATVDTNYDVNGYVVINVAPYITSHGTYHTRPYCADDANHITAGQLLTGYYNPDYNILINDGNATTKSLTVDLTLNSPISQYYALSCDGSNWTEWVAYTDYVSNFRMDGNVSIGCVGHGTGVYYVYASFYIAGEVYTNYDTIRVVAERPDEIFFQSGDETQGQYFDSGDTEPSGALSSYVVLATPPMDWAILFFIFLILIVVGVLWYTNRRRRGY